MHKLCDKTHKHASLEGGKAKHAAIWPKELCLSILRGLRRQLIVDNKVTINGFGTVCEEKSYDDEVEDIVFFEQMLIMFPARR